MVNASVNLVVSCTVCFRDDLDNTYRTSIFSCDEYTKLHKLAAKLFINDINKIR